MLNDRKSLKPAREASVAFAVSVALLNLDAAQKAFATCLASQGSFPTLRASASKPAEAASLIPVRGRIQVEVALEHATQRTFYPTIDRVLLGVPDHEVREHGTAMIPAAAPSTSTVRG